VKTHWQGHLRTSEGLPKRSGPPDRKRQREHRPTRKARQARPLCRAAQGPANTSSVKLLLHAAVRSSRIFRVAARFDTTPLDSESCHCLKLAISREERPQQIAKRKPPPYGCADSERWMTYHTKRTYSVIGQHRTVHHPDTLASEASWARHKLCKLSRLCTLALEVHHGHSCQFGTNIPLSGYSSRFIVQLYLLRCMHAFINLLSEKTCRHINLPVFAPSRN